MDKYRLVPREKVTEGKDEDEIRVTAVGSVSAYVSRAAKVFGELEQKRVVIKASGNAMTKAVTLAEVVKHRFKGLHQITNIYTEEFTDKYEPLEEGLDPVTDTRKIACIEICLSKDQLNAKDKGYQPPIDESLVKDVDPEELAKPRGRGRGRGKGRGRGASSKGKSKGKGKSASPKGKGKGKGKGKDSSPKGKGKGKGKESSPKGKGKGKGKGKEDASPKGKSKGKGKDTSPKGKGKGKDVSSKGKGKGKGKGKDYWDDDYYSPPKGKSKGKGKGKDASPKGKSKGKGGKSYDYDPYFDSGKGKGGKGAKGGGKGYDYYSYDAYGYDSYKGKGKSSYGGYDSWSGKGKGKGWW